MIKWDYKENFRFYVLNQNKESTNVEDWQELKFISSDQYSILKEFLDNGLATKSEDSIEVEAEDILKLDTVDAQKIGLPELYPFIIFIGPKEFRNIASIGFEFDIQFYDFYPNGEILHFTTNGPLLYLEDELKYILSEEQNKVIQSIKTFNSLPENDRTSKNNFLNLSQIQNLSINEAISLDNILNSQRVLIPKKILIDVEYEDDVLKINPTIDGIENSSLDKSVKLNILKSDKPNNLKDNNNNTVRVILDSEKEDAIKSIKRYITDKKVIDDIVKNPEKHFNIDVVDIKKFSDRVKEIGIYKPKFYPFITPYKSEWIPGIIYKDKVNGDKKIHFKSVENLEDFKELYKAARNESLSEFEFEDQIITVQEAEDFILVAEKQFLNTKEPIKVETADTEVQTLIIQENIELLEYIEDKEHIKNLDHTFTSIENLNTDISLKAHQEEGIAWLQSLYNKNFSGGLLADDMGLGKTLQILYFIEWHSQLGLPQKPYLIIAPVSLLENWKNEYDFFFENQNLKLEILYGKISISKKFNTNDVEKIQNKHIILTNYETLKSYQLNLAAVDYSVVILDEAQKIKTPGTLVTNATKALKADFKIAMTGTPVENTLLDLWSIMDFCIPGLLGTAKEFTKKYQKPLKSKDTDLVKLGENLREEIGVFIKRRLKVDVAKDLPEKRVIRIEKEMPPIQYERYLIATRLVNELREGEDNILNYVLTYLRTIKDISDHPYLADSDINLFNSNELIKSSAKLQILVGILKEIKQANEKVIIFTDRRNTQKMIQKVVKDNFDSINYPSIVNGDTPSIKSKSRKAKLSRQQTIDKFQSVVGFNIIIMSPLAAGTGLNVTEANHVIHYSRHWNPAKEDQATDRAYRIGQQKNVNVYYPMAVFPSDSNTENNEIYKSFDQILNALLKNKKALATKTLFPSEQSEVKPADLFNNINVNENNLSTLKNLTIEDIDKLTPYLFEAYVAVLYLKQNYESKLTPISNDKGADVVAIGDDVCLLIQVKKSSSSIDNTAVQEIKASKNYYSNLYGNDMAYKLVVITNNIYSNAAITLAKPNAVELIDRKDLKELSELYPINYYEINQQDQNRMTKI